MLSARVAYLEGILRDTQGGGEAAGSLLGGPAQVGAQQVPPTLSPRAVPHHSRNHLGDAAVPTDAREEGGDAPAAAPPQLEEVTAASAGVEGPLDSPAPPPPGASTDDDDDDDDGQANADAFRMVRNETQPAGVGGGADDDPNDPDGVGDDDDPVLPLYGDSDYSDDSSSEEGSGSDGMEEDGQPLHERSAKDLARAQRRREKAAAERAADDEVAARNGAAHVCPGAGMAAGAAAGTENGGPDDVAAIVSDWISTAKAEWEVKHLAALQREAPDLWADLRTNQTLLRYWSSEENRLQNVLTKMRQELHMTHVGSGAAAVRKACAIMTPSLHELWDLQFKQAVCISPQPPPPPPPLPPAEAPVQAAAVPAQPADDDDVIMHAGGDDDDGDGGSSDMDADDASHGHGSSPHGARRRRQVPGPAADALVRPVPAHLQPGSAVEVRLEGLPGAGSHACWLEGVCHGLVDAADDDGEPLSWDHPDAQARVTYPALPAEVEDASAVRPVPPIGSLRALVPGAMIEVRKGPTGAPASAKETWPSWLRGVVLSIPVTYPAGTPKITAQHLAGCAQPAGSSVLDRLCAAGAFAAAHEPANPRARTSSRSGKRSASNPVAAVVAVVGDAGVSRVCTDGTRRLVAGPDCSDAGRLYDYRVASDFSLNTGTWSTARTDLALFRTLHRVVGTVHDVDTQRLVKAALAGGSSRRTAAAHGAAVFARRTARGPTRCDYHATISVLTAAVRMATSRSGTVHDVPAWLQERAAPSSVPPKTAPEPADEMDADLLTASPTGTRWTHMPAKRARKAPPAQPAQPAAGGPATQAPVLTVYSAAAAKEMPLFSGPRQHPETRAPITVSGDLAKHLRPHQWEGLRFMWDNLVTTFFQEEGQQPGCVLAHSMGLGKTLQVLTLLHSLYVHEPGNRTLILAPKNVVANWASEFAKWLPTASTPGFNHSRLTVLGLQQSESTAERLAKAKAWARSRDTDRGMCLLMSTSLFGTIVGAVADPAAAVDAGVNAAAAAPGPLTSPPAPARGGKKQAAKKPVEAAVMELAALLTATADLVVVDEAHEIRNGASQRATTVKQLSTPRRLALTGSPLQNDLMEFYSMVDFCRPTDMGTEAEFRSEFVDVINAGRQPNASRDERHKMKKKLAVLWDMTENYVQRKDGTLLTSELPPKTDVVIRMRASPLQHALLARYVDAGRSLRNFDLEAFVRLVFDRPQVLLDKCTQVAAAQCRGGEAAAATAVATRAHEVALESQPADDDVPVAAPPLTSPPPPVAEAGSSAEKQKGPSDEDGAMVFRDVPFVLSLVDVFRRFGYTVPPVAVPGAAPQPPVPCAKTWAVVEIARWCAEHDEKVLFFSQFVQTLDCLQAALRDQLGWATGTPSQRAEVYRIDGDVASDKRQNLIDAFNTLPPGGRTHGARCFLLSTRAGAMGINLTSATRCVIVDTLWNPTFAAQAIHRCYRYGQTKATHVYRLLAAGWYEDNVYRKAAGKEELALRVVDKAPMCAQDRGVRDGMSVAMPPPPAVVHEEQARLRQWAEQHTDLGLLSSLVQKDTVPWLVSVCEHTDVLRRDVASQLTAKDRAEAAKEYINEMRVVDPSFRMTARHRRLLSRQAAREANDAQAGGGAGDAAGVAERLARATVAAMAAARPQRRETQPMDDDEDAGGDEIGLLPPPPRSASQRAADAITVAGAALHRTSSALTGLIARLTPRKRTAADMEGGDAAHGDSGEGVDEGEEQSPAQPPRMDAA